MAAASEIAESLGASDLYEFFEVERISNDKEITKAYRKKSLKYHPDKNPGDKKAADMFQKLAQAYKLLTDGPARAAYDVWLKAKDAAKQRNKDLSAKRRKLKEDLEKRESNYKRHYGDIDEAEAARRVQKEIARLKEQNEEIIKEQQELLRQELKKSEAAVLGSSSVSENMTSHTLKVTWKSKKSDPTNGGYNQQILEELFSKYGSLDQVLVSSTKKGKALISFHSQLDAQTAIDKEFGRSSNPLKVTWVSGASTTPVSNLTSTSQPPDWTRDLPPAPQPQDRDYETITLLRMRQAQERKRLAQQLAEPYREEDTS